MNDITRQAIERAGGLYEVARALGITRQAVEQWRVVPPGRCLEIEELSGISRHLLRPDIYGPAKEGAGHPKRRAA